MPIKSGQEQDRKDPSYLYNSMADRLQAKLDKADLIADPVKYLDFFPFTHWSKQKDITRSVFANKYTYVRSCNASGKTHLVGELVLAFLDIYGPDAKVITTAKNFDSMRFMQWSRIRTMYKFVRHRFGDAHMNTTDFQPDPDGSPEWFALGNNPKIEGDEAPAFQGHHARHVLFVVDEAILTPPAIWKAMEGSMMADGRHMLVLYNPTTTESSEVYQMEREGKRVSLEKGNLIVIKGPDLWSSPEYLEDPSKFVNLISPEGAAELEETYGRNSAIVKSRVYAEWPENDETSAIKKLGLLQAHENYLDSSFDIGQIIKISFGWDVAGDGDDNNVLGVVKVGKYGLRYDQLDKWHSGHQASMSRVWSRMLSERDKAEAYNRDYERTNNCIVEPVVVQLTVDAVGEGSHVKSIYEEWDKETGFLGILPFKGGEKAKKIHERKEVVLLNKNSEAWYRMTLLLSNQIPEWLPVAMNLTTELEHELGERKYMWGQRNKEALVWYIEPKDEWKSRNRGRSPDEADACIMAFYGYFHGGAGRIRAFTA